ncbi:MAG: zinc-ribbon domain-containing protein [Clostridiales bacterium]|nr:zinc-ribbon domain-containing protein [Clostridiales bacterium]
MFCEKCGNKLQDGVKFCPNCGFQVGSENYTFHDDKVIHTENVQNINYQDIQAMRKKKSENFGIAALVLGIISILLCITVFISGLCGILAIIFGIIQVVSKEKKGLGISGIITGGIGILLSIIFIFAYISLASDVEIRDRYEYNDYYDSEYDDDYYSYEKEFTF